MMIPSQQVLLNDSPAKLLLDISWCFNLRYNRIATSNITEDLFETQTVNQQNKLLTALSALKRALTVL